MAATSLAHPVDRPLHRAVEHPALNVGEGERGEVEPQHPEQDAADGAEVDALARDEVQVAQQVREVVLPSATAASMTCCLVTPAGICPPMMPDSIRSVARPRILGPTTLSATDSTPIAMARMMPARCGRRWLSRRRTDTLKFAAFSPLPAIGPCPGPPRWVGACLGRSLALTGIALFSLMLRPPRRSAGSRRSRHRSRSSPGAGHGCRGRRSRRPRAPGSGRPR